MFGLGGFTIFQIAERVHKRGFTRLAGAITLLNQTINQCEIHIGARIGNELVLEHRGRGIIIGYNCTIGNRVALMQHVTLGVNARRGDMRMPTIGDEVFIGADAQIIGGVTIGEGSVIGANALVIRDIPPRSLAVGIPAKVVKQNINRRDYYYPWEA